MKKKSRTSTGKTGRRRGKARPGAAGQPPGATQAMRAGLERTVEAVRVRYARIAEGTVPGCCAPAGAAATLEAEASRGAPEIAMARAVGYDDRDLAGAPAGANLGVGCGAPIRFLRLQPGETVLDLGSGGGLDAFLAAREVGPGGRVIGVDMTPEMIARARANAAEIGADRVEFREGRLEALPLEDASVDAVTSNCVINLVPDKAAVFREVARVLRPGGRVVVSDIVLDGRLPDWVERDLLAYVGCISGALERRAYFALVESAGLADVRVLSDADYLATAGCSLPDDLVARLRAGDLTQDNLSGKVRSITFSATRPAAPPVIDRVP